MTITQKVKTIFAGLALVAGVALVPLAVSTPVGAEVKIGDCVSQGTGIDGLTVTDTCTPTAKATTGDTNLSTIAKRIVNFMSIIVGVVAIIMIIVGGFKYITSGGDTNKISSAKNTIIYALIGLIIVALSQFIVWFVLAKTAGIADDGN